MGGGDDPPPYEPYAERSNARGTNTEDERLAHRMRALRMGDVSVSTSSSEPSSSRRPAAGHTDTRKRSIDTGSKSLKAQLDLYDLLSIRSSSGSVNVGIRTHPADKERPVPAKLMIESNSGSVKVSMPASDAPVRDYSTSVETQSASISGDLIHGRTTSVASRSGSITLQFTLSGAGKDSSTLSTTSESGRSDITVLTSTPIKQLSSTHTTRDGSLSLRYPREWEGTIEGHTQSGYLRLDGRDLEIIQKSPHYVLAKKGTGNSKLSFRTSNGSVSVCFE